MQKKYMCVLQCLEAGECVERMLIQAYWTIRGQTNLQSAKSRTG